MTGKSSLLPSQACDEQRKELNQNHCTHSPEESEHNYLKNLTEASFSSHYLLSKMLMTDLSRPSL